MKSSLRFALVLVLPLPLVGGCFGGSLATNTGPRASGDWSVAKHQAAHVGETVRFSFILTQLFKKHPVSPRNIADYCIVTFGNEAANAKLDDAGKFMLTYRMPEEWIDREIRVRATAYRRYDQRDRMVVGEQLLQVDNASDTPDKIIARGSLTMLVYQSVAELALTSRADDFNFATGRLVVRRSDGPASSVGLAQPAVGGFTVEGPNDEGTFTVRYQPRWDQVNRTGTTEAEFTVYDIAGNRHRTAVDFPTP